MGCINGLCQVSGIILTLLLISIEVQWRLCDACACLHHYLGHKVVSLRPGFKSYRCIISIVPPWPFRTCTYSSNKPPFWCSWTSLWEEATTSYMSISWKIVWFLIYMLHVLSLEILLESLSNSRGCPGDCKYGSLAAPSSWRLQVLFFDSCSQACCLIHEKWTINNASSRHLGLLCTYLRS